jgi:predicted SAM-dependent methyltransferase
MGLFDYANKWIPKPLLQKIDTTLQRVIYQSGAGIPFQELTRRINELEQARGTTLMLDYFEARLDNIYANLLRTPAFAPPAPPPPPPSLFPPGFAETFEMDVATDCVSLREQHLAIPALAGATADATPAPSAVGDPQSYLQVHQKRLETTLRLLQRLPLPADHNLLIDLGAWAPFTPMVKRIFPDHRLLCVTAPGEQQDSLRVDSTAQSWVELDLESEALPVPSESANVVLLLEVVEHLYRDPMFVLSEINRVLVPGGQLVISTPNLASWRSLAGLLTHYSPYTYGKYAPNHPRNRHVHEYVPRDLVHLLGAAGFDSQVTTEDVYHSGSSTKVMTLLQELGLPTGLRGDTIFAVGTKVGPVNDRHPAEMYDLELIRQR